MENSICLTVFFLKSSLNDIYDNDYIDNHDDIDKLDYVHDHNDIVDNDDFDDHGDVAPDTTCI